MKMNMIVSKKHIVLSALVLALSVAVYLNWEYVKVNGDSFENTSKVAVDGAVEGAAPGIPAEDKGADEAAAYGEAYFAEAKLSRTKARDEAADALKYMLEDADLTTDQMTQLTMEAASIAKSIETEGKIENLIKAKGFDGALSDRHILRENVDAVLRGLREQLPGLAQLLDGAHHAV